MKRTSRRAGWIATGAIVACFVALFFTTCEKREIEIPSGYRGAARSNPYLAAQRMLERMGGSVKSYEDAGVSFALPSARGTVILPTARRTLSPERSAELLRWAESGGHLVLVVWQLWDDENRVADPILDPLGFRQLMNPEPDEEEPAEDDAEDEDAEDEDAEDADAEDAADDELVIARARFPGREERLEVFFDPRFRFELAPEAESARVFEIADANGAHWVTRRVGKGYVTALTDDYFLTHPTIANYDHAELAYRLAHFRGRAGPIAIVFGDEAPGLAELAWRRGWPAFVAGGLLVAVWLAYASRRFGPIAPDPPRERRALMEHVRAAGRFQWRRGAAPALLGAAREALLARVRERHPRFDTLSPAEQAAQLAALAELSSERVARALAFQTDTESSRFAHDVAILEKIRRAL